MKYRAMYYLLFNAVTDALKEMQNKILGQQKKCCNKHRFVVKNYISARRIRHKAVKKLKSFETSFIEGEYLCKQTKVQN